MKKIATLTAVAVPVLLGFLLGSAMGGAQQQSAQTFNIYGGGTTLAGPGLFRQC